MRIAAALLSAAMLCGCGAGESQIGGADVAWVLAAQQACPPVSRQVDRSFADGTLSNDEVDAIAAAIRTVVDNPVKGQVCDPRYRHRPEAADNADMSTAIFITAVTS
jgi:hypothetical protein